jgi:hypothetical protein
MSERQSVDKKKSVLQKLFEHKDKKGLLIPFGLEIDADAAAMNHVGSLTERNMWVFKRMFPSSVFSALPQVERIGSYIIITHLLAQFWNFITVVLKEHMSTEGYEGSHPPSIARAWHCTLTQRPLAEKATMDDARTFAFDQLKRYAESSGQPEYAPLGAVGIEVVREEIPKMLWLRRETARSIVPYTFVELP